MYDQKIWSVNFSKLSDEEVRTQSIIWLQSYYRYVKAFDRLWGKYKAIKNMYRELVSENESLKAELQRINRQNQESALADERLLRFKEQWDNPVKHIRSDITNEEIIELYSGGMKPYRIAKVMQEKKDIIVSYRTIISRINRLKEKGMIQ